MHPECQPIVETDAAPRNRDRLSQAPIGELKLKVLGLGSFIVDIAVRTVHPRGKAHRRVRPAGSGIAHRVDVDAALTDLEG